MYIVDVERMPKIKKKNDTDYTDVFLMPATHCVKRTIAGKQITF